MNVNAEYLREMSHSDKRDKKKKILNIIILFHPNYFNLTKYKERIK